jgi:hypothetical protein
MKFKTLSNREVRIDIVPSRYPIRSRSKCKSDGQYFLGRTISAVYGAGTLILEEFSIPETRLAIDFYLPHNNLAFEYQGKQHDQFVAHFHGDKKGFERQKERDKRKRAWCELNDILLIEIRESTITADELRHLIQEARHG